MAAELQDERPFTRDAIYNEAPRDSGVYVIRSLDACIYVGESSDIQMRLFEHLADTNGCVMRNMPFTFAFELTDSERRMARRRQLTTRLRPLCSDATG